MNVSELLSSLGLDTSKATEKPSQLHHDTLVEIIEGLLMQHDIHNKNKIGHINSTIPFEREEVGHLQSHGGSTHSRKAQDVYADCELEGIARSQKRKRVNTDAAISDPFMLDTTSSSAGVFWSTPLSGLASSAIQGSLSAFPDPRVRPTAVDPSCYHPRPQLRFAEHRPYGWATRCTNK